MPVARLTIVLCVAAFTLVSENAISQESPILQARARVRIWGEGLADEGLVGRLFTVDGDTLRLFADSARLRAFPVGSLRRFEVSRGRDPWVTVGIPVFGAAAGGLVYPLLTTESFRCREGIGDERECGKETPDGVVGAGAGLILSAVLVNILAQERWVGVPLDQLAIKVHPRSWRVAIAVNVGF